jgi:hypothetical protein
MKSALLWLLLILPVLAGPWDPFPLTGDPKTTLYDPRIASNLVYAVNERCLVSGVEPMDAIGFSTGFMTRVKLELLDAKIAELFATGRWVCRRHALSDTYNAWYRKTAGEPLETNWVAYLPRMNPVETFDTLPVGIARMVFTNVWDYRPSDSPAEAWWTFWPDKPIRGVMGSYMWITNQKWVAACAASDSGLHQTSSEGVNGYWIDTRFYYSTDETITHGASYNVSNLATWGVDRTLPPVRPPALSGRFYEADGGSVPVPGPVVLFRTNGWGVAHGAGDVTVDFIGWLYLSNCVGGGAWGFDTQQQVTVESTGVDTATVSPGGETPVPQVFYQIKDATAVPVISAYQPNRFLKADRGGIHEGDTLIIRWDEDALPLYGGPSVFNGTDHTWATLLFAECLDERYQVLDDMRWTTSTNYGWTVVTGEVVNVEPGVYDSDPDDYINDEGILVEGRNRETRQMLYPDWIWETHYGYAQASIGGMEPAEEPFDWICPHDTGNFTDFSWPADDDVPWPTFFAETSTLADATYDWSAFLASTGPDLSPRYTAAWKEYSGDRRRVNYYAQNPEYWTNGYLWPCEDDPGGTVYFNVAGRFGRQFPGVGFGPDWMTNEETYQYLNTATRISFTNVVSKPWVDLDLPEEVWTNLPNFEVDFYLYATNAWWTDDAPQEIPVKRQMVQATAPMGVVTGTVESALEAGLVYPATLLTNSLFALSEQVAEVGIDVAETNIPFYAYVWAEQFTTSFYLYSEARVNTSTGATPCTWNVVATNWRTVTTNYWKLRDVETLFYLCEDPQSPYQAWPPTPDPDPVFQIFTNTAVEEYDPPQDCPYTVTEIADVQSLTPELATNHCYFITNVVTYLPPSCADGWLVLQAASFQDLEWWSVQPATNCVVGQWEPVIRWDVVGGFKYVSD